MKPPPFLLAAALLLWGWQTGLIAFALLMAVVLEAARWIEWRVDFGVKDFNRVVDLVSLLGAVGGIYCILTREATNQVMAMFQATNFTAQSKAVNSISQTTFIFFQWFPMILFPAVAALAYSTSDQVPRSCFPAGPAEGGAPRIAAATHTGRQLVLSLSGDRAVLGLIGEPAQRMVLLRSLWRYCRRALGRATAPVFHGGLGGHAHPGGEGRILRPSRAECASGHRGEQSGGMGGGLGPPFRRP